MTEDTIVLYGLEYPRHPGRARIPCEDRTRYERIAESLRYAMKHCAQGDRVIHLAMVKMLAEVEWKLRTQWDRTPLARETLPWEPSGRRRFPSPQGR